jgi:hypothetical protein
LVIAVLGYWHGYATQSIVNRRNLAGLMVSGITLCYFDWVAVFLLAGMTLWALAQSLRHKQFTAVALCCFAAAVAGVFLVFWQFASYLGWQQVINYWTSRFAERSTDTSQVPAIYLGWNFFFNQATSFGPLALAAFAAISPKRLGYPHVPNWLLVVAGSVILYNLAFFNWSALHEFAWMAGGLVATLLAGVIVLPMLSSKRLVSTTILVIALSIALYYAANPPGYTNWKGEPYDRYMVSGNNIAQRVPADAFIFTNAGDQKITEFYARRTFQVVENREAALKLIAIHQVKKAVWLEYGTDGSVGIEPLAP